jgi:threo-3-hydroxy-L-aspartate ammonia-lyase
MNNITQLDFDDVVKAHQRIEKYINKTPIFTSEVLNKKFGAQVFFKMENEQVTKSFKARGAFNAVLAYKEKHGKFPEKIVVQSSGNHAQAIASACKEFGIKALVYMITKAPEIKVNATRALGAEVILLEKRAEVNATAEAKQQEGYFLIHPSDNDDVICGQGTAALEALEEIGEVEAIFAPCGGGGIVSGCFLAAQKLSPKAKVFACEPLNGNDVARSIRENRIVAFEDTPNTIADGARTLHSSKRCLSYIKQMAGVLEIKEEEIAFWQQEFSEILSKKIETTSALAIAGVEKFLKENPSLENPKILVIISGGNIA